MRGIRATDRYRAGVDSLQNYCSAIELQWPNLFAPALGIAPRSFVLTGRRIAIMLDRKTIEP